MTRLTDSIIPATASVDPPPAIEGAHHSINPEAEGNIVINGNRITRMDLRWRGWGCPLELPQVKCPRVLEPVDVLVMPQIER